MKTFYKSGLSLAVLFSVISASTAQWIQTSGPLGGYVYDFAFLDTIVYSANSGALFRSTINGTSWSQCGLTGKDLTAVEVAVDDFGNMNLYACASGEGVFLSTDSGNTWNTANTGLNNFNTSCIAVTPNGLGGSYVFVGTLGGGIYRSFNNGTSWNSIGPPGITVYDIAGVDSILIMATTNGIFLSDNNGISWTLTGLSTVLTTSVAIVKQPVGNVELFAATSGDGVFRSSNNGMTWVSFNNGFINFYPTDFVVNDTTIYVSLYGQGVLKTTLNSAGWTLVNTIEDIRTIAMYNNGGVSMFFMGIDDGTGVYRSPNGTFPNYFVDGMINANVNSVASIYNGAGTSLLFSGYFGEGGRIMRSNDYGANWLFSTFNNMLAIRSFPHNISGTMLIAGGTNIGSRCSADSGVTWNLCIPDGLWSIAYAPLSTGGYKVFAGTGTGIFQTVNSGSNWFPFNTGLNNTNIRAVCISDTNVFAGTANGVYTASVNGSTWTLASNGITSQDIHSMAAQGIHLFAGTFNFGVFHSTNNGLSWTHSMVGIPGLHVTELIFHGTTLFAATSQGVFYTTDYGVSWMPFSTGLLTPDVNDLAVIDSFLVAGTRLGVWIRPLSQIPTGIGAEPECNTNDCYQLHIYPNPFSNSTSIEFTIRDAGIVKAEIFDLHGKCVSTLVNENLLPAKYNYAWDATGASQGVYFLRITSVMQTQTRRLVRME